MKQYLRYVKKLLVYVAAVAAQAIAYNVVPDQYKVYVLVGLAALGGAGVYGTSNGPKP